MIRRAVLCLWLVLLVAASAPANAAECFLYDGTAEPGAQVVILDQTIQVEVTFCDGTAGYTSEVFLDDPGYQYIATGHVTPVGTVVDLGVFAEGTELIFAIYVQNTGYTYYTGPGARNPDGVVHAAVVDHPDPNTWNIGFEDMYGGGDKDYDDINLVITGALAIGEDQDDDGIVDDDDNCVFDPNPDQSDVDEDGMGDVCDECPYDPDNDVDDDGVCGDLDNCPAYPNPDQSDLDDDGVGDACDDCTDVDGDGVCIEEDVCAGTVPDVPLVALGTWRWIWPGEGEVFITKSSRGRGPKRAYSIVDTAGCSCAQIIEAQELGLGHSKFGCSISAMDDWVALVDTGFVITP
jgi:hypothetical protein